MESVRSGNPEAADRWSDAAINEPATRLLLAEDTATDREPLTDEWPGLDLDTAYQIQDETLCRRIERGETLVGVKLGLTSQAKQRQMNVDRPLTAWLTDAMALRPADPLPWDRLIHPRVEPEIVFVMGRRLSGPGVTAASALAAVDRVHGGLEIIDSRYRDFRFTLPDVVADNASSAYFLTGPLATSATDLQLPLEACNLEVNGQIVATATGAAVQGNPAEALAMAANSLSERGHAIEPGWIVMTGGMTDALPLAKGSTVTAHFTHLGSVSLHC